MVSKLHILLTYNCSLRCKHCYVFSDQRAPGKISLSKVSRYLNDGKKMPGLEWVYFGGGEPFTQYPLLLKAIQRARKLNYRVGVETNGYFARTVAAGIRMLRPLANLGVEDLRISNDRLHYLQPEKSPAHKALIAAGELGIPTTLVYILQPGTDRELPGSAEIAGQVDEPRFMYTGRATELFADQFAHHEMHTFDRCPRGDLADPGRIYLDAYGFAQICPGIAIGNACEVSLDQIINNYDIQQHEIFSQLQESGPRGIAEAAGLPAEAAFADACHVCYASRKMLVDQYPTRLGPRHVYGF